MVQDIAELSAVLDSAQPQLLVYDLNFRLFDHPRTKLTRLGSFKQGQHCFLTKKMNQPGPGQRCVIKHFELAKG